VRIVSVLDRVNRVEQVLSVLACKRGGGEGPCEVDGKEGEWPGETT
jgi:hypothetical protein